MVSPQGTLSLVHMSTKGVAVIPEISPGETSASYISGNWMYQDGAAACHVWVGAAARPEMAWAATVASAWTGQALTVAALPRPAAYPSGPGSVG
jgi:hypothetical protein